MRKLGVKEEEEKYENEAWKIQRERREGSEGVDSRKDKRVKRKQ